MNPRVNDASAAMQAAEARAAEAEQLFQMSKEQLVEKTEKFVEAVAEHLMSKLGREIYYRLLNTMAEKIGERLE